MLRAAVVQHPPVFLDLEASLARAVALIGEAADGGAGLVVFPEAWLPGYPTWIWRLRPGADMAVAHDMHRALAANAVDLGRDGLRAAARGGARARRRGRRRLQRDRPKRQQHALQQRRGHRRRRPAGQPPPQADADQPRAHGLGLRRRQRPARRRDRRRTDRLPDLLGELHAAGARRALRRASGDPHRPDLGHRRQLARHDAPHRPRVGRLGDRLRHAARGRRHPRGLPAPRPAVPRRRRMDQRRRRRRAPPVRPGRRRPDAPDPRPALGRDRPRRGRCRPPQLRRRRPLRPPRRASPSPSTGRAAPRSASPTPLPEAQP